MLRHFKAFVRDDAGAVTVDWVVLTAAVVGLAASVIFAIQGGTDNVGDGTGTYLSGVTPGDL